MQNEKNQSNGKSKIAYILDQHYAIYKDQRLNQYDTKYCQAYRAIKQIDNDNNYFVLIGKKLTPPRLRYVEKAKKIDVPHVLVPLGWDAVIDGEGREQPALLFQIPRGQFYLNNLTDQSSPLSADACVSRFLRPMTKMLGLYHQVQMMHRALSPLNLFVDYSGRYPDFTMGQCFSDPAGTVQPIIFETITSGLANLEGRGPETASNDIYALAVMIVTLIHGRVPMAEKSEDQILRKKLRSGSYSAIIEGFPMPPILVDPIRGMLNDNPEQRWDLKNIETWMQGRQVSSRQHFVFAKGKVPFHLEKITCNSRYDLAYELGINWEDGIEYADKTELANWVRRSLNDEERGKALMSIQVQAKGNYTSGGTHSDAHTVLAHILSILDPLGPVRISGLSFTPTGLGSMILHHLNNRKNNNILKHSIHQELIKFWYRYHIHHNSLYTNVIHEINLALHAISQEKSEHGMERLLYTLNCDLPCLSPFFDKYHVFGLGRFMDMIEQELSTRPKDFVLKMDRHMIAYIAVHHRHTSSHLLKQSVDIYNKMNYAFAQVTILSMLQNEYTKKPYPMICNSVCNILNAIINNFKNLPLQERMRKRLQQQCHYGRIESLLNIVDDQKIRQQDQHAYDRARKEYHQNSLALNEIATLREHLYHDAHDRARSLSVTACAMASGLGLLAFLV